MNLINQIKDKAQRHKERHQASDHQFVIADSIAFMNFQDWNLVAEYSSIFLSPQYLSAIEACSPENTIQKYAIAYKNKQPVVIVVCQIAEITGGNLSQESGKITDKIKSKFKERVLVCGNLVSSGLHGVGMAPELDPQMGWRIVAEVLYRIRRVEKLAGKIDFVLVKDIKKDLLKPSEVLERFSYRRIQTDPDMVLDFGKPLSSFDDYLAGLTSKYRGRINKIIKTIDQGGLSCEKLTLDKKLDQQAHQLYLQVESKAATRLATLPVGYFLELQKSMPESFCCYGIKRQQELIGFVSIIKDQQDAIAYYVGLDYKVNKELPIYFRLLQLVIQSAIDFQCTRVLFGRTALEPKASLGAKPIEEFVWARHRVPVVNFMVRKLFRNIPFDIAPERSVTKK
jgi:hypothetical protein